MASIRSGLAAGAASMSKLMDFLLQNKLETRSMMEREKYSQGLQGEREKALALQGSQLAHFDTVFAQPAHHPGRASALAAASANPNLSPELRNYLEGMYPVDDANFVDMMGQSYRGMGAEERAATVAAPNFSESILQEAARMMGTLNLSENLTDEGELNEEQAAILRESLGGAEAAAELESKMYPISTYRTPAGDPLGGRETTELQSQLEIVRDRQRSPELQLGLGRGSGPTALEQGIRSFATGAGGEAGTQTGRLQPDFVASRMDEAIRTAEGVKMGQLKATWKHSVETWPEEFRRQMQINREQFQTEHELRLIMDAEAEMSQTLQQIGPVIDAWESAAHRIRAIAEEKGGMAMLQLIPKFLTWGDLEGKSEQVTQQLVAAWMEKVPRWVWAPENQSVRLYLELAGAYMPTLARMFGQRGNLSEMEQTRAGVLAPDALDAVTGEPPGAIGRNKLLNLIATVQAAPSVLTLALKRRRDLAQNIPVNQGDFLNSITAVIKNVKEEIGVTRSWGMGDPADFDPAAAAAALAEDRGETVGGQRRIYLEGEEPEAVTDPRTVMSELQPPPEAQIPIELSPTATPGAGNILDLSGVFGAMPTMPSIGLEGLTPADIEAMRNRRPAGPVQRRTP